MITHMGNDLEGRYQAALELVNVAELARQTGRAHRTVQSYQYGERQISPEAARELVEYLQHRAQALTVAADRLAAALPEEEDDGGG